MQSMAPPAALKRQTPESHLHKFSAATTQTDPPRSRATTRLRRRPQPTQFSSGRNLRRSRPNRLPPFPHRAKKNRANRLARPNHLPPRPRYPVPRSSNRLNAANRRSQHYRRTHRHNHNRRLPPRRHRPRRPRRPASPLRRLSPLPPSQTRPRLPKSRRHRQHHGNPRERQAISSFRLRHRPRQHASQISRTIASAMTRTPA